MIILLILLFKIINDQSLLDKLIIVILSQKILLGMCKLMVLKTTSR